MTEFLKLFNDLIQFIKQIIPFPRLVTSIIFWIFGITVFYRGIKSDYYKENWQIPHWDCQADDKGEKIVSTNIKLAGGYIVICPQLIVKYRDQIVYIVNIENLYNINGTEMVDQGNGEFLLEIDVEQKDKLDKITRDFKQILIGQLSANSKESYNETIDVYVIKLAKINYQNADANQESEMFIYISATGTRRIIEKEVNLRATHNTIDLDLFGVDQSVYTNEQLMNHVENSMEIILNL